MLFKPVYLQQWIADNRDRFKPPVCNQVVWEDTAFIVMLVSGPNVRTDYHVNEGEEFFYQLEGEMLLKIIDDDRSRQDIAIHPGEIFLLPPRVPHLPVRFVDSMGLVVEHKRQSHQQDGFQWYCDQCNAKLYEEFFHLTDVVKELPPVFERFYSNPNHTRCGECGYQMPNAHVDY